MGGEEVVGGCLYLRSSDQETAGESGNSGRSKTASWHEVRAGRSTFSLGRFQHPEHQLRGTSQSNDLPGLLLSCASYTVPRSTRRILEGPDGFDDDVLQFCAAAYGIEIRQNSKNSSHASRISHEKVILPRGIHGGPFIFPYCSCRKKSRIGFRTISARLFEGVVTTQQHFPGEAPKHGKMTVLLITMVLW